MDDDAIPQSIEQIEHAQERLLFEPYADHRSQPVRQAEHDWVLAMAALRREQDAALDAYLCTGLAVYDVRQSAAAAVAAAAEELWNIAIAHDRHSRRHQGSSSS